MGSDDVFQPKSVIAHAVDYIDNIQMHMGIINFDIGYGNFTQTARLAYELTFLIEQGIKQGNIDLKGKDNLIPNAEAVYKLRKLFDGQCYLTVEHGEWGAIPETELFHYDKSKFDFTKNIEVIPIPALSNMTPVGQIKEDTLLIEIHEAIPCKFAWQGLSYMDICTDGLMVHNFVDGSRPKISEDQMGSTTDLTRLLSREVYFRLISKERNKYIRIWAILYNNYHAIIEYVKMGGDVEDELGSKISAIGKID